MKKAWIVVMLVGFWLSGCEQWRVDKQMDELCKKDGGLRVHEKVVLAPDLFTKDGLPNFYNVRERNRENWLGPEYRFDVEIAELHRGSAALTRDRYQIIRRADGKILGEFVSYLRRGGDMPGPWHDSYKRCPPDVHADALIRKVFVSTN